MLLKFATKDFLDDRKFKNASIYTLKGYEMSLSEFHDYCVENEIVDVEDITPSTVKGYLLQCQQERGNNPTSINTKLRRLKAFFNYLEEIEVLSQKRNPTKRLSFVKENIQIEVFKDHHISQMLNYYRRLKQREKSFFAYRDHTMIVFLLGTGVRLGELCNLRWNDVDLTNGIITVLGKKRQQSSVPITDKLIRELCEYRLYCEQNFKELSDYVFVNSRNMKLTENAVQMVFKRLKTVMNFKDVRLSPHTFRHYFAHKMITSGCDIFTVQKLLRHSDLSMVNRYLALWGTALKEMNDKHNPLNNIDL